MVTDPLYFPSTLRGSVDLPGSKSLSNRALIIAALADGDYTLQGLSQAEDTRLLAQALQTPAAQVDIRGAGTAMRFLTAYYAVGGGAHYLTGNERMKQRPIGPLVEALRSLGADIDYTEKEGFPPLRIRGRQLRGGCLHLSGSVSSQYVSALLLIAPYLSSSLRLRLEGTIVSRPYINMTLALMRHFGAQAGWEAEDTLIVAPAPYQSTARYRVETDWSSAACWYETVALATDPAARLLLRGLREETWQGDARVQDYFLPLGVKTTFCAEGAVLEKTAMQSGAIAFDLSGQPDLAQSLVVACAALQRPFRFTGLQTLRIKETDRLAALARELDKLGITVAVENDESIRSVTYASAPAHLQPVATYEDHRMALAFAPCALRFPGLQIVEPTVVNKSYPGFWEALQSLLK